MFKSVTLQVSLKLFKQTDKRFKTVHDEIYGDCILGENITGDFYICRDTVKH